MPKLPPPPPRSAQYRSVFSLGEQRTIRPSASTTSAAARPSLATRSVVQFGAVVARAVAPPTPVPAPTAATVAADIPQRRNDLLSSSVDTVAPPSRSSGSPPPRNCSEPFQRRHTFEIKPVRDIFATSY